MVEYRFLVDLISFVFGAGAQIVETQFSTIFSNSEVSRAPLLFRRFNQSDCTSTRQDTGIM